MKIGKKIIIIGITAIVIIVVVAFLIIYFFVPGKLSVSISEHSPIKEDIVAYLSNDKFNKPHFLPLNLSLRRGKYTIYVVGKDSDVFLKDFSISGGLKTSIIVTLNPNPISEVIEGSSENPPKIPDYLKLLPYKAPFYNIEADTTIINNEIIVTKLTITSLVVQGPNQTIAEYKQTQDTVINEAKKWIKDNGIPESIPIEVIK